MTAKQQDTRLTNVTASGTPTTLANATLRFYQNGRFASEKGPQGHRSVLWTKESAVAQLHGVSDKQFLQTDLPGSILCIGHQHIAYSPYGYRAIAPAAALLGFNGQYPEPLISGYFLGNGYRLYSPAIMRLLSPDNLSPFDEGGINTYAYCLGDPINHIDPDGHTIVARFGLKFWKPRRTPQQKYDSTRAKLEANTKELLATMNFITTGDDQPRLNNKYTPRELQPRGAGNRWESNKADIKHLKKRDKHLIGKFKRRAEQAGMSDTPPTFPAARAIQSNYDNLPDFMAEHNQAKQRISTGIQFGNTSGNSKVLWGSTYMEQMRDPMAVDL